MYMFYMVSMTQHMYIFLFLMFHLWFCLILLDLKINLYQCQCQCQYVCLCICLHMWVGVYLCALTYKCVMHLLNKYFCLTCVYLCTETSPLIYFVYKLNCFPNLCHTLGVTVCECVSCLNNLNIACLFSFSS